MAGPAQGSTATKSTDPKKRSSFHLFGRRKKKEEKTPASQQQGQSASPPSAGRKRSNALTPAQARETQEMLKRQRELEQAKLAHNVMVKRSWFADQMRQRENEKAGAESGGLRIPHDGNSEERRQAVP